MTMETARGIFVLIAMISESASASISVRRAFKAAAASPGAEGFAGAGFFLEGFAVGILVRIEARARRKGALARELQRLLHPRASLRRERRQPIRTPRLARQRHLPSVHGVARVMELAKGQERQGLVKPIAPRATFLIAYIRLRQPSHALNLVRFPDERTIKEPPRICR